MFSQLRNAVEQLATQQTSPQPNRRIANGSSSTLLGHAHSSSGETQRSPTNSVDEGRRSLTLTSPNQLAESAISNLRKTLMSSRSSSPAPSHSQDKEQPRRAATLEERLKASFIVGDASERTTPEPSKVHTPNEVDPISVELPLSPDTVPFISSQELSLPPLEEAFDPLGAQFSPTPSRAIMSPPPTAPADVDLDPLPIAPEMSTDKLEGQLHASNEEDLSLLPPLDTSVDQQQQPQAHASEIHVLSPSLDPLTDQTVGVIAQQELYITQKGISESETGHLLNDIPTGEHLDNKAIPTTDPVNETFTEGSLDASSEESRHESHIDPLGDLTSSVEESSDIAVVVADSSSAGELEVEIERLRMRLKLFEQRFTDVSTSFKRLEAEKYLADQILKDHSPVASIADVDALRDHFKHLGMQAKISMEEIKRLNATIKQHDVRLDELRDTHRLESSSQSEQIERLRQQVLEIEALLSASEEFSVQSKADIVQLQAELEKAKGIAKEEEEKRTKAISLLKTVRAKLVKSEKEKEEALKDVTIIKEREKVEKEKERQEKGRLEGEFDQMKKDKEREMVNIRSQFEKELVAVKERSERENGARRGQFELEAITTKASHNKELAAKNSRIISLEMSIRSLSEEKDSMFDQLQMRQAELESSQSHLDSVEARTTELQYQLREAESRIEILTEELSEMKRNIVNGNSSQSSAEELARILSETDSKYEARISELRSRMRALEKERQEAEDEWSRNLQERSRELERLRSLVDGKDREYAESIRTKTEMLGRIVELQAESRKLRVQKEAEEGMLRGLQNDITWLKETEASTKQEREELSRKLQAAEKQAEEGKVRENVLKTSNKTLREELHKVQASAALLERQRNPGIGYWSTSPRTNGFTQSAVELQNPGHATQSSVDEGSNFSSTRPSSPTFIAPAKNDDEEVNLEYLRNVILQFLEHKEMRPNLVRVLSIILHFTPQETRRLIAKV